MTDFTKLSPEDLARVTTRDGRKVEIISTKGREPQPVIGYIDDGALPSTWGSDGNYYPDRSGHQTDLILPPAPRAYYANGYEAVLCGYYKSAEAARANRSPDWLALYKIADDGVNVTIEVIERNRWAA